MTTLEPARRPAPELLRVATAGSVDDGKSTLIGRLLHDTQVDPRRPARRGASSRAASAATGGSTSRCSPTACAPSASRASRSTSPTASSPPRGARSSSPTRPGHVRYTRNMVTGASTADVALVLIDARQGVVEQSKRHAFIASLLRRPARRRVREQDGPRRLGRGRVRRDRRRLRRLRPPRRAARRRRRSRSRRSTATTSSSRSDAAPWYDGPPLLEYLEEVDVAADRQVFDDARLPVQWVVRPHDDAHHDYRGHAGQVAGGTLRVGDEVVVLPQGARTRIARHRHVRRAGRGGVPADVGHRAARGRPRRRARRHARARPTRRRRSARDLRADVCWLDDGRARPAGRYLIKHTTRHHARRS